MHCLFGRERAGAPVGGPPHQNAAERADRVQSGAGKFQLGGAISRGHERWYKTGRRGSQLASSGLKCREINVDKLVETVERGRLKVHSKINLQIKISVVRKGEIAGKREKTVPVGHEVSVNPFSLRWVAIIATLGFSLMKGELAHHRQGQPPIFNL